ncbi:MAG TPA: hypothetical protein VGH11_19420 [Jatrophihabitans sp.]|jgi:diadenosine tetraphosphate (Ap4A) HIT family hydrolase
MSAGQPPVPRYTAAVLAAIRAGERDGRLPAPSAEVLGSIFPFEPDVAVVAFDDPVLPEPARHGESAADCASCGRPDSDFAWTSAGWRLSSINAAEPMGVHAFMLTPREHADLADLPADRVAELGPLMIAVEKAISTGLDGVGRVHINRWGDGGAHLHWWFIARPVGLLQLRGSQLPTWLDILPPLPEQIVVADVARVVSALEKLYG